MGWEKEYNLTIDIIIKNFNKGLEYKNDTKLPQAKFEKIQKEQWDKVENTDGLYYSSKKVYERAQYELSYNLPQHGWIVIGGYDSLEKARPSEIPDSMKFYYTHKERSNWQ